MWLECKGTHRIGLALARKRAAALAALACFALAFASTAFAQSRGGVAPPESATDSGDAINQVYWVVFATCAFVFFVVEAVLILFILRFRRRKATPAAAEGPQIHGNTRLEIFWTVVPSLMLLALAIFTFVKVPDVRAKAGADEPRAALRVGVVGHQFYWQYEYPNGALSYDMLYLPVGRTVTLSIASADVPHSWWVPELTGKLDAIPGQTNELHFTPEETGTFTRGKCGEFCGIQHAVMLTTVEVLPEDEFDRWLDENERADAEELGKAEWEAACAKCHGLEGEGDIGPPIAGNGTLTNREGLDVLVRREGQDLDANEGYMPPVGKGWSDEQLDALIAYVKSDPKLAGEEGGE